MRDWEGPGLLAPQATDWLRERVYLVGERVDESIRGRQAAEDGDRRAINHERVNIGA